MSANLLSANGNARIVLMLCGRSPVLEDNDVRANLEGQLRNQRIEQLATSYLADLRAAATITGN